MMIVATGDTWVTANFKETQLAKMYAGQRAKIHVDALKKDLEGTVESIPAITGARSSVLPPGERHRQLHQGGSTHAGTHSPQREPGRMWNASVPECRLRPPYGSGSRGSDRLQSVGHRHDGDAGDVHGGAGHLDCQRCPSPHCREPGRNVGREHVGADQLPGLERHHSADERVAVDADWPQAFLHGLRGPVHAEFHALRPGDDPADADRCFA